MVGYLSFLKVRALSVCVFLCSFLCAYSRACVYILCLYVCKRVDDACMYENACIYDNVCMPVCICVDRLCTHIVFVYINVSTMPSAQEKTYQERRERSPDFYHLETFNNYLMRHFSIPSIILSLPDYWTTSYSLILRTTSYSLIIRTTGYSLIIQTTSYSLPKLGIVYIKNPLASKNSSPNLLLAYNIKKPNLPITGLHVQFLYQTIVQFPK
jgi:hypothetical protein